MKEINFVIRDVKFLPHQSEIFHEFEINPTDILFNSYDITEKNLMTVEQAKGLEFGTVIAISGRMTPNKKYITFTRALDELYIYDQPLKIDSNIFEAVVKNEKEVKVEENITKKKKEKKGRSIDYSKSVVREYFENKGLEVIDMRPKSGTFWVIGEKEEINLFAEEACEQFGISGAYSSGKITGFRTGWYSKTKK